MVDSNTASGIDIHIALISDYVCLWCYIGKARLERLQQKLLGELHLVIDMKPYVLYPHIPPGGSPKSDFSKNTKPGMGRSLRAEAKEEHIKIKYKLIKKIPNSLNAHRLTWLVSDLDQKYQLAKLIFRGYFEEGGDIEDNNYLTELSRQVGIDEVIIDQFINTDNGLQEVNASIQQTKEQFVTVVPSMRLENEIVIPGLQSIEVWENYIRRAVRLKSRG